MSTKTASCLHCGATLVYDDGVWSHQEQPRFSHRACPDKIHPENWGASK